MLSSKQVKVFFPEQVLDYVHCDNVAYSLLLAERALRTRAPGVAGEVFIVTNGKPLRQYDVRTIVSHVFRDS
jgi:hypothetical protein